MIMDHELITQVQTQLATQGSFSSMENFKEIYDIGKMFASSSLVPQTYQGKSMDCTIAVDMANRMNVSPMMVMQNLYIVRGKPSWSGQSCRTLIDASGKFKDTKHVYTGEVGTDTWGCYLQGIRVSDGELVKGPEVTIKMAKDEDWYSKAGSKWKTMPELMLAYRANAFFARVHTPNVLMGIAVEGEVEDITGKKERQAVPDVFAESEVINDTNQ